MTYHHEHRCATCRDHIVVCTSPPDPDEPRVCQAEAAFGAFVCPDCEAAEEADAQRALERAS